MTKQFDWIECAKIHSPVVVEFLRAVQATEISEQEFSTKFSALPREGKLHATRTSSPSSARQTYRHLRDNFDFFTRLNPPELAVAQKK